MKKFFFPCIYITLFFVFAVSCRKDSFITSSDALLSTSADTLHFDTVFTSAGSVTKSFKIFNLNDQKLRLSNIELAGGANSFFKMNVDGSPGTSFTDIEIAANDSIYVFVSVNIDPDASSLPFFIQDSILISYNGNNKYVQLDAYGQNAFFLKNAEINKDTTWTGNLPIVILGGVTVKEGATLTIERDTKVYLHADAPLNVNGKLLINGEPGHRVLFTGDRLDDPYKYFPASWPGIIFSESSSGNILDYASLENATQAIVINGDGTAANQLQMKGCIINNSYKEGLFAINASINAENCLISDCGENNLKLEGGNYSFIHCTVASYSNILVSHNSAVLHVSDQDDQLNQYTLNASFVNSIFYGEGGLTENEVEIVKSNNSSVISFENVLYKAAAVDGSLFTNSISNIDPGFILLDFDNTNFDFHLSSSSPCVNAGKDAGITDDLDGNPRDASLNNPDIGCYELQ